MIGRGISPLAENPRNSLSVDPPAISSAGGSFVYLRSFFLRWLRRIPYPAESTMTKNQQSKPQNEHGQQNQEPKKGQNPHDPQNRVENPKHQERHDEKQHRGDKQPTR